MMDDEYDGGGWRGHRERRPLLRGTKACRKLQQITRNKFDFSNCNQHFANFKPQQFPSAV